MELKPVKSEIMYTVEAQGLMTDSTRLAEGKAWLVNHGFLENMKVISHSNSDFDVVSDGFYQEYTLNNPQRKFRLNVWFSQKHGRTEFHANVPITLMDSYCIRRLYYSKRHKLDVVSDDLVDKIGVERFTSENVEAVVLEGIKFALRFFDSMEQVERENPDWFSPPTREA